MMLNYDDGWMDGGWRGPGQSVVVKVKQLEARGTFLLWAWH